MVAECASWAVREPYPLVRERACGADSRTSGRASDSSLNSGSLSPCFNLPALRWRRGGPDELGMARGDGDVEG